MSDRCNIRTKDIDEMVQHGHGPSEISTRIAPPSASERNDHLAIRPRTRRERPRKLRIIEHSNDQDVPEAGAATAQSDIYEPDIESFVSGCIPGVSLTPGRNDDDEGMRPPSQRRTRSIRKRSLPSISFLSSTHLAAAEQKRKKEKLERQNAIAEEAAKKALLLNPIQPAMREQNIESSEGAGPEIVDADHAGRIRPGVAVPETPTVETTIEMTSNILMPPLLKAFLDHPKFKSI
mmetsp:Transcript_6284/g.15625  ORF Transcript_6284/g.15625 Transcript_6284/m.15625 type:complete len:235 (-) Transcript_6284:413-1117(-)